MKTPKPLFTITKKQEIVDDVASDERYTIRKIRYDLDGAEVSWVYLSECLHSLSKETMKDLRDRLNTLEL